MLEDDVSPLRWLLNELEILHARWAWRRPTRNVWHRATWVNITEHSHDMIAAGLCTVSQGMRIRALALRYYGIPDLPPARVR